MLSREKQFRCAILDKKQIAYVIMEKRQLACAFTEKRDMSYHAKKEIASVIMKKDS